MRCLIYSLVENLKYSICFVVLSRVLTQAAFALLRKMLYLKLLFIDVDNGVLKGSVAILIKAGGIWSWPIAFLGENIVLSLVFYFTVIVLLLIKVLGWFL